MTTVATELADTSSAAPASAVTATGPARPRDYKYFLSVAWLMLLGILVLYPAIAGVFNPLEEARFGDCLLYTSPSPRDS